MALIDFGEEWNGRSTQYRTDFRRGIAPVVYIQEKQHVRTFYAETDDGTTDGQAVITDALAWAGPGAPLPIAWSAHPNDANALLVTYEAAQQQTPEVWQLRANYATYLDPILEPADLQWAGQATNWVVEGAQTWIDSAGTEHDATTAPYPGLPAGSLYPVTNSAYEMFSPPPTELEPYRVLTVLKNFAIPASAATIPTPTNGFDPLLIDNNYTYRINSQPFTVPGCPTPFPVDTVLLSAPPQAKWTFQKAEAFYATSWVFWIRKRPWYLRAADMGWNQLVNAADPTQGTVRIVVNGQFSANQQKLNGAGRYAPGRTPVVYLTYRTKLRADFNELNLFQGM
jgi:hypothetical protein